MKTTVIRSLVVYNLNVSFQWLLEMSHVLSQISWQGVHTRGPAVAVWSIVMSVFCMSVCLSTCISRKPHVQISLNFVYMLPVAVARFSHDSSAIHYVLQVLWITSFFHIMEGIGQNQRWHVYFIKFAKWWHRMDVRKRCLVKITRLLAALGRCLPSATAPCTLSCSSVLCCFVDMQF